MPLWHEALQHVVPQRGSVEASSAAAAAKAVGGGLDGPAAVAARRAALLGQAAVRRGFGGLGGVGEHIRALREHVALPLRVWPCFAAFL